jgi:hypothetical protein
LGSHGGEVGQGGHYGCASGEDGATAPSGVGNDPANDLSFLDSEVGSVRGGGVDGGGVDGGGVDSGVASGPGPTEADRAMAHLEVRFFHSAFVKPDLYLKSIHFPTKVNNDGKSAAVQRAPS